MFLKISQNSQKNVCARVCLFFNKVVDLRPATLLKRDPGTGIFLWILRNFSENLFYITPQMPASEVYISSHQRNTACECKLDGKPTIK